MAGYSGTPLAQKLGIKPGHRVALLGAPADFHTVLDLPTGVSLERSLGGKKPFDVIVLFAMAERELARRFVPTSKRLQPNGGLWVAWPKKASGVVTDVTENAVRGVALAAGLVDNKVCAVNETWSGLRCVIRVTDRPKASGGRSAKAKRG
ncbi:MAG TPA: DUF3052 family protein [Polyangiaceae bacterium]|nr:DUF3052 family protein [Polyangiaceae bacterium]